LVGGVLVGLPAASDGAELRAAIGVWLGCVLVLVAALLEPVRGVLDVLEGLACHLAGVGKCGGGDGDGIGSGEDGFGPGLEGPVVVLALRVVVPEATELQLLFGGDLPGRRGSGGYP
jgi:hypothetical protein